jgi:hypothetical protein
VWNHYNQVNRYIFKSTQSSHTYYGAAYRAYNNDTSNKISFVLGVAQTIPITLAARAKGTSEVTVGLDTFTANSIALALVFYSSADMMFGNTQYATILAGGHYLGMVEWSFSADWGYHRIRALLLC